tara:strand:- start:366 stop:542 length:177 start_codon:yes stop_codon:yes gene_type:complete
MITDLPTPEESLPVPGQSDKEKGADAEKPVNPNDLSEEEQMALYEKDLKDTDWGHQPC